jgi:hypothetical protein
MRRVAGSPFRRAVVPLAFYYAVTLAVPLANGADWSDVRFQGHAAAVLLMPLILTVLVYGVCGTVSSMISRVSVVPLPWQLRGQSARPRNAAASTPLAPTVGFRRPKVWPARRWRST